MQARTPAVPKCRRRRLRSLSLRSLGGGQDVVVTFEVLDAITGSARALCAVAKIHVRMAEICDAADNTSMERQFFRLGLRKSSGLGCHMPLPGSDSVFDVGPEEEQIVANRGDNEQSCVPFTKDQNIRVRNPCNQGEPLNFYRENKEDVQHEIRIQESKRQENRTLQETVGCGHIRKEKGCGNGCKITDQ